MARVLVVHAQSGPRSFLEGRSRRHHQVLGVADAPAAIKALPKFRPNLILAHTTPKGGEAAAVLRGLKRENASVPVLIVAEPAALSLQPALMRLGAAGWLEYPMEQDAFDKAVAAALQHTEDVQGRTPPITEEETSSNISDLERILNKRMQCFAGKNQVYIQSFILGGGKTSTPRVALKCPLRKQFGQNPDVYFEFIRDVCCGDPTVCEAYQKFQKRYSA